MGKMFSEIIAQLRLGAKVLKLSFDSSPRWSSFYLATNVGSSIIPSITFYLTKITIDAVIAAIKNPAPANINFILLLTLITIGINTINSFLENASNHGYDALKDLVTKHTLISTISKSAELDMAYFESSQFHDQLEKVHREVLYRPQQAATIVIDTISSITGLVSLSFIILRLGWWAPIVLLVFSIPRLLFRLKYTYYTYSITDNRTPQSRKVNQLFYLLTRKESAAEVKTFNLKKYFVNLYHRLNDKFILENRELSQKQVIYSFMLDLFGNLSYYLISLYVVFQTIYARLTIGDLTMLTRVVGTYQQTLSGIFASFARFYENNLFLQHYFTFMDMKPKVVDPANPKKITIDGPLKIEFKNVSFEYDPGTPILKNINFCIDNANNFALVGENGAGKTTLIKLLLRLYDPTSGQILINDIDIREISQRNLHSFIGIIFQDFMHYEMTAAENIAFGDIASIENLEGESIPPAVMKRVREAARLSGASEFIEKLPDQYNSILGKFFDKGVELSGGQWQKVALARAFFSKSPIIALDEPTASLDPKSEYEVFKNLITHTKTQSLILISHRFSTVRLAQEIVVLHDGEIVEQGSHENLMKKNGRYAKLYNLQAKWYK